MFGLDTSVVQLATVIMLCGLVPSGLALAEEQRAAGQEPVRQEEVRQERGRPERGPRLAAAAPVDAAAAIAAAAQAGYAGVTELEWERGGWDLKARDAAGAPVRIRVNGWTGQVTRRHR